MNRNILLLALFCFANLHVETLRGLHGDEPLQAVQEPVNPFVFNEAVALDSRREDWVRAAILDGRSESWSRLQAERSLAQRVAELEKECNLTSEQSSKLLLAGRGDIANYFRDIENLARELIPQATVEGLNKFIVQPEVRDKLEPLKERWRSGLHGFGSFYQGVLKQTLSEEQIQNIEVQHRQKDALKVKQQIMALIINIERSVPLNSVQRNKLLEKLEASHLKIVEGWKATLGAPNPIGSPNIARDFARAETVEDRYWPMLAALSLTQKDLETFLDKEQVAAMMSLQQHWRLNVPYLNAAVGGK